MCHGLLAFAVVCVPAGQEQAEEPPSEAVALATTWFERWNALDGSPESVAALVELYLPDGLHLTAPARHQEGTVTFRGHEALGKMATDFAAANEKIIFRIESSTASEQSRQLFHLTDGPWGGPTVAVEYVAAYTRKMDGQRFYYPGAAFFQLQDGKIRRARFYMATGELAEVEADVRPN